MARRRETSDAAWWTARTSPGAARPTAPSRPVRPRTRRLRNTSPKSQPVSPTPRAEGNRRRLRRRRRRHRDGARRGVASPSRLGAHPAPSHRERARCRGERHPRPHPAGSGSARADLVPRAASVTRGGPVRRRRQRFLVGRPPEPHRLRLIRSTVELWHRRRPPGRARHRTPLPTRLSRTRRRGAGRLTGHGPAPPAQRGHVGRSPHERRRAPVRRSRSAHDRLHPARAARRRFTTPVSRAQP